MQINELYNRKILIATKHQKERVIGPILEQSFNMDYFTIDDFDSDCFGTFTGEVERKLNAFETVKKKALTALSLVDSDIVIASEGSFGSHPNIFFASCNEEFLYLYDKKNSFEITVKLLSTNTNFSSKEINSTTELTEFLDQIRFPSHAIIIIDNVNNSFYKGLTDSEEVFHLFNKILKKNGSVLVESDMRAMCNPTRMENIRELSIKLVDALYSLCPNCLTPGFQVSESKAGLPCLYCNLPTNSTLSHTSICKACHYRQEKLFPFSKEFEDPMYCNFCNP